MISHDFDTVTTPPVVGDTLVFDGATSAPAARPVEITAGVEGAPAAHQAVLRYVGRRALALPVDLAGGEALAAACAFVLPHGGDTASSFSDGDWLWMSNSRRLWGRHADIDSPSSGSGPALTAGWHTLVRVWDRQEGATVVGGIRTSTTAVTASDDWPVHRLRWQYFANQRLTALTCRPSAHSALPGTTPWSPAGTLHYLPCLGRRWMQPLAEGGDGGGSPLAARRPVVILASS